MNPSKIFKCRNISTKISIKSKSCKSNRHL